jgi:Type II CAAX prenyl endopeptidase Rce1-like
LWLWLLRPFASFGQRLALFVAWLFAALMWSTGMSMLFGPRIISEGAGSFDPAAKGWIVLPIIAILVTFEEMFRLLPLALTVKFSRRGKVAVLMAAVVTAALFGAAHVSNGLPLWFVLICQGVTGLVMNLLYLKGGGLQGQWFRGFAYALAFHIAFDYAIIIPALLLRDAL